MTQADALGLDDTTEADELGEAVKFEETVLDDDIVPEFDVNAVTLPSGGLADIRALGDAASEWLAALVVETVKVGDAVDEAVRGVGAGSDTLGVMVDDIEELTIVVAEVEDVGDEVGV